MKIGDLCWVRDIGLDWKMKVLLLKTHEEFPTLGYYHVLETEEDGDRRTDVPFKVGQNAWIDSAYKDIRLTVIQSVVD